MMSRRSTKRLRRLIVPVGRGRSGKTTCADALFEEMQRRGVNVTAWDIDRAPHLNRRIPTAQRPVGGSDAARQACLEKGIHDTIFGDGDAIVDVGADDVVFHLLTDKLPELVDLLAEHGLEIVAVHVLGPDLDKDTAYFRATRDGGIFTREIVVLNHCLAPKDIAPDDAFAAVRNLVRPYALPTFVVRALPPEVMKVIWPEDRKAPIRSLHDLSTDAQALGNIVNMLALGSWLRAEESSISCIIDAILAEATPQDDAAAA